MSPEAETFRNHLIKIRMEMLGLSKRKIAEKCGISYTTYLSYEQSENPSLPSAYNLVKLKYGLGITFEKLLEPFITDLKIDNEFEEMCAKANQLRTDRTIWEHLKNEIGMLQRELGEKRKILPTKRADGRADFTGEESEGGVA